MNPIDTVPLMLLAVHMLALGMATIIFLWMIALHRRARTIQQMAQIDGSLLSMNAPFMPRPAAWLAICSPHPKAVQAALGLNDTTRCPWTEGIAGKYDFFIGSPVNNWIIVTGSGLPQPGHDVDRAFHFLVRLSRVLGDVQFFMANPVLHHHAWVRVENGSVKRAYAWAGQTVWNQGAKSLAEMELNMKCFGYAEEAGTNATTEENVTANVTKVFSLAARWSIDPTASDRNLQYHADGIAGESSFFWQD